MKKRRRLRLGCGSILLIFVALFLLRGPLFRAAVSFEPIRERSANENTLSSNESGDDPIRRSLEQTADTLSFTFGKASSDPAVTSRTGKAHCVGYARHFVAIFGGLDSSWSAATYVGHVRLFGVNVHPFIDHPFFKDHDFVLLTHRERDEQIAVDPTVYDYFGIEEVTIYRGHTER